MDYDGSAWQRMPKGFMPELLGEPLARDTATEMALDWIMEKKPATLLDVGCLDGRYVRWLRARGWDGRYAGIDITPAFIDRARVESPGEEFLLGDIRLLGRILDRRTFDFVLCSNLLQHLPEIGEAAAALSSVSTRWIQLSVYGAPCGMEESHASPFLNYAYGPEIIRKAFPVPWEAVDFLEVIPEWDSNRRLHLHRFRRPCQLESSRI